MNKNKLIPAILLAMCGFTVTIILAVIGFLFFSADEDPDFYDENFDFYAMEEWECLEGEKYDAEEKYCYYECETDEECDLLEAEISDKTAEIGDDYFDGEKDYQEVTNAEESVIITYNITDGALTNPETAVVDDGMVKWQTNTAQHNEIWNYFADLIPASYRSDIIRFEIFTDGKEGTYAAVNQAENDLYKWVLAIDIVDVYTDGSFDAKELTYSLIHEFGHVLTLNSSQVSPDTTDYDSLSEDQVDTKYDENSAKCAQYFTGEGCSYDSSYINKFFNKFWADKYQEFLRIDSIVSDDEYEEEMMKFFDTYASEFVTEYAGSNPGEDIAESWTAFILQEKPKGSKVSDMKILFFYDFPELVKLRSLIRQRIK